MAKTESCLVETEDIKSLSDQQNRTPKVFCLTFGVQFFRGYIKALNNKNKGINLLFIGSSL